MLYINGIMLMLSDFFLMILLFSSIQEREWRAVWIALLAMVGNSLLWLGFILYHLSPHVFWINVATLVFLVLFGCLSMLKWMPPLENRKTVNAKQYDERDYMFSRNNLKNHPELAAKYYETFPEKDAVDQKIHKKPEIGLPGHLYYESLYSPVFDAAFTYLGHTRAATVAEPHGKNKAVDKEKMLRVIYETAHYYGAVDVGVTRLQPYHIYSHAGRRAEDWGKHIHLDHPTAIAIVVAMDVNMMKHAPTLSAILESSKQYVEAAKVANIIAEYIRGFGYQARAHTDGNYQVLCVPVAVDAGVGHLGRLGLLMHPVYGPCVRISVVTTDLELAGEQKECREAAAIHHFCKICKKCADNCPTQSICLENEPTSRGFSHWSINQETCFSYWKNIGTDCGFCIRVCPFTKPNTLIHKLVRFYISRNPINQQIALKMDDFFYGRKKTISNKNPKNIIINKKWSYKK